MNQILLVEDSKEIYLMVIQSTQQVAELSWAKSIEEAKAALSSKSFDLLILDVELPDGNGIEFCSSIQSIYPNILVFFLTSHTNLSEKVLGFSAGADDYITKPFLPLELKASLESRLRKTKQQVSSAEIFKWHEIEINKNTQNVSVLEDNVLKKLDLTSLEFKLLLYFAAKPGIVIAREDILNDIWGEDIHVYQRSVDTHVSKLRKKLGAVAHILESVHGAGYKFNPTAQSIN